MYLIDRFVGLNLPAARVSARTHIRAHTFSLAHTQTHASARTKAHQTWHRRVICWPQVENATKPPSKSIYEPLAPFHTLCCARCCLAAAWLLPGRHPNHLSAAFVYISMVTGIEGLPSTARAKEQRGACRRVSLRSRRCDLAGHVRVKTSSKEGEIIYK